MKKILLFLTAAVCCSQTTFAQSPLDKYFVDNYALTTVGDVTNGLLNPQDLDFIPGTNNWWVLNYEGGAGSVAIFYNAGQPNQKSEFRRDSHSGHFMIRASALAIGHNGNFATAQEIQNTNGDNSTFMGPALWSTDTSIFARLEQSNWEPTTLLGSHLDMLHASPFGMGIAHDEDNAYWYFDGYNGNICHYDFKAPHIVGGDDHADGEVLRYSDVTVKRKPGVPSHMAVDHENNWLYIVDGGNNRIIRMKTNDATDAGTLPLINEPLAVYKSMTGATVEVVVGSELSSPCGIDYKDGRIVVSDNATGDIIIYDVTQMPASEVGRIKTGSIGVMGVRVDYNNRIWYVNRNEKKLVRIDNSNVPTSVESQANNTGITVYPNPAGDVAYVKIDNASFGNESTIKMYDMTGRTVKQVTSTENRVQLNTSSLPSGIYTIEVTNKEGRFLQKLSIQ